MVRLPPVLAAWAALCLPAAACAQAPQLYPPAIYLHGDPTAAEQQTLQLINRARRDPVAESYRLAGIADFTILGSYYGVTRDAFLGEFRGLAGNGRAAYPYPVRQALAFNPVLIDAARRQNAKQATLALAHQPLDHYTGDGATSVSYASQAGYRGRVTEDIGSYVGEVGVSGVESNENILLFDLETIDPRYPIGHRQNILGDHTEAGIAVDHLNDPSRNVDVEIRTDAFGVPSQNGQPLTFITGVVFSDTNFDGHYTPGEGLGGVFVQPDHGYWSAYTSASGGYAIPLCPIADAPFNTAPGAGLQAGDTVTLTFSGGPLREPITRTVVLPGHSVEVNVAQPQEAGFPGAKRPALSAAFTPETGLATKAKVDGSVKTTLQGALRLTNLGKKNTGTFRVILLLAAAGSDGTDLTGATPLAEMDVANVGKKGGVDLPLAYKVKEASGRVVVALVDVLEKVPQTEREALRPTVKLP